MEWDIPLHYLWSSAYGLPGVKFEGNGKLRFRADVGSYREKPGAPPFFPLRGMVPTKDSSLPLAGSGSHTDGSCTTTLSGSGVFPSAANGAPLALVLAAPAYVDANTPHVGGLGLAFGAAQGALPFRLTVTGQGCSGNNPVAPTFGLLDGPDSFPSPDPGGTAIPVPGLKLTVGRTVPDPREEVHGRFRRGDAHGRVDAGRRAGPAREIRRRPLEGLAFHGGEPPATVRTAPAE